MPEETHQEMTIRNATIFSLEQSQNEFDNLKTSFQSIADLFDTGRDSDALVMIKDDVIPKISSFYQFCYTLIASFETVIPEDLRTDLCQKLTSIDNLNNTLMDETEAGNFTEVGDILRFDFYDLITEFSDLFPKLVTCFKDSKDDILNQY